MQVTGIEVDGSVVAADAAVIAMGPWSQLAAEWLPLPEVYGQQSPSLVYDTRAEVPADALFLEYRAASGDEVTVEVFPRADGSTHVCAFSGAAPLPLDPARVAPDPDVIERLRAICERLSPAFRPDRIIARQVTDPLTHPGTAQAVRDRLGIYARLAPGLITATPSAETKGTVSHA